MSSISQKPEEDETSYKEFNSRLQSAKRSLEHNMNQSSRDPHTNPFIDESGEQAIMMGGLLREEGHEQSYEISRQH